MDRRGLSQTLVATLILGGVSTLGDWIWANYLEDGAIVPALVHGIVIFVVLAVVLGRASAADGATTRLLIALPPVGLGIAAVFYPLAAVTGYLAALVISWFSMWIGLATLGRWASRDDETTQRVLLRAFGAAVGSGFAFWTISSVWTNPSADPNYLLRLLAWTWAFLPGFAALILGRKAR